MCVCWVCSTHRYIYIRSKSIPWRNGIICWAWNYIKQEDLVRLTVIKLWELYTFISAHGARPAINSVIGQVVLNVHGWRVLLLIPVPQPFQCQFPWLTAIIVFLYIYYLLSYSRQIYRYSVTWRQGKSQDFCFGFFSPHPSIPEKNDTLPPITWVNDSSESR